MSDAPVIDPAAPAVDPAAPAAPVTAAPAIQETPSPEAAAPAEVIDPKMVVPESADGYTLPVPEGSDGAFAKTASAWFHEAGIPPAQAEKLAAKWNEFSAASQAEATQAAADAEKQAEASFKADDSALRKEWGSKYDSNIELGKRAYREFGFTNDVVDAIEAKVGSAQLFKIFAKIGQGLGEDTALGLGNGNNTLTMASAAEKLYGSGSGKA